MTYDAIIVGGGVVGISIAYHLVQAGARTLLIDRADSGQATAAGAGILTAETNSHVTDSWLDFTAQAVDYYPGLIAQLAAEQAGDTGYGICGQIVLAATEDEIAPFESGRQWMFEQQRRRGSPAPQDLYDISPDEARELFPPLGRVLRALYYRNAARVDGRLLAQALYRAAEARGLSVVRGSVEQILIEGGAAAGVLADGQRYSGGAVAIAGGAWSPQLGAQLGIEIPVAPLRGQIIHLGLPGQSTGDWPLVRGFHGHYIVAWPDSRVVAGATHEHEAGFLARSSVAGVQEVLAEALRVAPGLSDAEIRDIRVGLRPNNTADGMPVLGAAPGIAGLYLSTGHGAYGLHLGPFSGKLLASAMLGQSLDADISMLSIARYSQPAEAE